MKMPGKVLGAVAIAMLAMGIGSGVRAQSDEAAPPPPTAMPLPGPDVFYRAIGPGPEMGGNVITFEGFEGEMGGKTVTGAPFTATISTETSQTLADGNHIQRNSTGAVARDSQGRVRREMTLPAIGAWASSGNSAPHIVFISDPVSGARYMLDTDQKTATRLPAPREFSRVHEKNMMMIPKDPEDLEKEVTTVSLGTQTINGVSAEGTRITRTIPVGQIGNEKPIVSVTERWYSSELQTVVMTKHSDPRMGERVFQLTNIQREEPDASLFQVPPDYTVKEGRARFFFRQRVDPEAPDAPPLPPPPPPGL